MDLLQCYDKLGLKPECGWRELQSGYRRLVQKWHPDRYQQHPEQQHVAAHRMLEINEAYGVLAQYYRQHGELPFEPPRAAAEAGERFPADTATTTGANADFDAHLHSLQVRAERHRLFDLLPWLIIISICALAYYYFSAYRGNGSVRPEQSTSIIETDPDADAKPVILHPRGSLQHGPGAMSPAED